MFKLIESAVTKLAQLSFFVGSLAMVFMMFHIAADVAARPEQQHCALTRSARHRLRPACGGCG